MFAVILGGSVMAQQSPGTTTVAPVNVGAVPIPQIGQPARMYTPLELKMLATDASVYRDRFEDDRAEI